jgi:hypothetical protein
VTRREAIVAAGALLTVCGTATAARAQTLSVTNSSVSVPAPTEAQYDAVAPNNVSGQTTTAVAVTFVCAGNGNNACSLRIAYPGPPQTDLQFQLASWSKTVGGQNELCNAIATAGTWTDVPTTASAAAIATGTKGATCTGSVLFRVKGLTYTKYQSGTTYAQGVALTLTRP